MPASRPLGVAALIAGQAARGGIRAAAAEADTAARPRGRRGARAPPLPPRSNAWHTGAAVPTTTRPLGSASPHAHRERSGEGVPRHGRPLRAACRPPTNELAARGGPAALATGNGQQDVADSLEPPLSARVTAVVVWPSCRPPFPTSAPGAVRRWSLRCPIRPPGQAGPASGRLASGLSPPHSSHLAPAIQAAAERRGLVVACRELPLPPAAAPPKTTSTSHAMRRQTHPSGLRRETPAGAAASQRRVAVSEGNGEPGSAVGAGRHGVGRPLTGIALPHVEDNRTRGERARPLVMH